MRPPRRHLSLDVRYSKSSHPWAETTPSSGLTAITVSPLLWSTLLLPGRSCSGIIWYVSCSIPGLSHFFKTYGLNSLCLEIDKIVSGEWRTGQAWGALGASGVGLAACTEPRLSHILLRVASTLHAGLTDDTDDEALWMVECHFGAAVQEMVEGLWK